MRLPLLCAFFAFPVTAQIVVDPGGSGSYLDLQTAIHAAPSGATIHVVGGVWDPITIDKSLTIVGGPAPSIEAPWNGTGVQPPAITLQGTGIETATLVRLNVRGNAGSQWSAVGTGLVATGFAEVRIYDSLICGAHRQLITGPVVGAPGIQIASGRLVLERSQITGSGSHPGGAVDVWCPDGVEAIDAGTAHLLVLDSQVRGGDCAPSNFVTQPGPAPCPCPGQPGTGGPGVRGGASLQNANSFIVGGRGSSIQWLGAPGGASPWGQQPSGASILGPTQEALTATLIQQDSLRLGASHSIASVTAFAPSVLVTGFPASAPSAIPGGPLAFVDLLRPYATTLWDMPVFRWSMTVPLQPSLIGVEIVHQRFDLGGSVIEASNPIFCCVLP